MSACSMGHPPCEERRRSSGNPGPRFAPLAASTWIAVRLAVRGAFDHTRLRTVRPNGSRVLDRHLEDTAGVDDPRGIPVRFRMLGPASQGVLYRRFEDARGGADVSGIPA